MRVETKLRSARMVFGRYVGSRRHEASLSAPFSFSVAFIGHVNYPVMLESGRVERRNIHAHQGTIHGGERLGFLGDGTAAEFVEITPSPDLLARVAEEVRRPEARELGEVGGLDDAILWSVSALVRTRAYRGEDWTELEGETVAENLTRHLMVRYLGGRPARGLGGRLDQARLDRVIDYVEANPSVTTTLSDLASVAALSPFHFSRAFKRTMGLTPYQYVNTRAMTRARELLRGPDASVGSVARALGYASDAKFRAAFRRQFGEAPAAHVRSLDG